VAGENSRRALSSLAEPAARRAATKHLRASDPVLRGIVDRIGPCAIEVYDDQTPFAALLESICYQQLTGKAAATIHGRVVKLAGRVTPGRLASLGDDDLRAAGLSWAKIASVRDLCARTDRTMSMRSLEALEDDAVVERLSAVRGIGRWTAEIFLIFRMGRPDVLPVGDYGVRKAMQIAWSLPELPKPAEMQRLAEPWRPWRTAASWYLWKSRGGAAGRA
jgi:3-methyladenine DNA glycosylase/8-oxoguanine DNA glycosylase